MENHHFRWKKPVSTVIFHSYVSLPRRVVVARPCRLGLTTVGPVGPGLIHREGHGGARSPVHVPQGLRGFHRTDYGGWVEFQPTPLKKIWVNKYESMNLGWWVELSWPTPLTFVWCQLNWDDESPTIWKDKQCSKPPTTGTLYTYYMTVGEPWYHV